MHCFKQIYKNKKRLLKFGVLSNEDKNVSRIIMEQRRLQKLNVGDNKPDKGDVIGDSM